MPGPGWTKAIIYLTAIALLAVSALSGESIGLDALRWVGGISAAIILAIGAFDRRLWRAPGIMAICEAYGHPRIHGTWRGTMRYEADGEGRPGATEIYLAIQQTYSSVSVRCYFPLTGSESKSLTATLLADEHRKDLLYVFRHQAPAPDRGRNRSTDGVCELAVAGRPVRELGGSYYAERGGKGTILARAFSPHPAGSLEEARRLVYEESGRPA